MLNPSEMDLKRWTIFQKLDPKFVADIKRAYFVGLGGEECGGEVKRFSWVGTVLVMKNDDVYSVMTSSTVGHQLLRGLCNDEINEFLLPYVPVKMDALCGQQIRAISSGVALVTVLTMDGRIYQWGQTMVDTEKKMLAELKFDLVLGKVENRRVTQVACGVFHTLALTEEGEVYSWGNNCWGQLGTGSRNYAASPTKVSGWYGFDSKIVSVACCCVVSLALDRDGNLWSWGRLISGALGYASSGDQLFPTKISLGNIKKIAAGDDHVLALSNTNEVYFWGHQRTGKVILTPLKVKQIQNVVDIGAMLGSSVGAFKTSEGLVYFWGFAYGQAIMDPVVTEFISMTELFASLDFPMMLEPLELNGKHSSRLEKLRQSFDNTRTGDIIFRVDEKLIYAHKTILKVCGSDQFGRMFENNEQKVVVEIAGFSHQCFRTYLLYLYTDRIEPPLATAKDAAELFKLAHDYEEEDLKARCEQQLGVLTTVSNVSELYAFADQHKFNALHDFALEFIIPNYNSVVKTEGYRKLSWELMIKLTEELSDEGAFVGMKRMRKE